MVKKLRYVYELYRATRHNTHISHIHTYTDSYWAVALDKEVGRQGGSLLPQKGRLFVLNFMLASMSLCLPCMYLSAFISFPSLLYPVVCVKVVVIRGWVVPHRVVRARKMQAAWRKRRK